MKIDDYRRLIDRNKDDEVRAFGRRLLRKAGGRALVAALPSKEKIRAVARQHVDVTLGLADLRLRLGSLRLSSNVFHSLNERFETASWDKEDDERYRFYSQFELDIVAGGGAVRHRLLADTRQGRWRCRTWGLSRAHLEDALARPAQRVLVIHVRDQETADRIADAARPDALSVSISTQVDWDRAQNALAMAAIRTSGGKMRRIKLTRAERARWNERLAQHHTWFDDTPARG